MFYAIYILLFLAVFSLAMAFKASLVYSRLLKLRYGKLPSVFSFKIYEDNCQESDDHSKKQNPERHCSG
jgi:hypothetical protein